MAMKSCLTSGDIAKTEAAMKKHKPVSAEKQKLIEKQEKLFYALDKDSEFQKSIAGMNKKNRTTAIQERYTANGIKITKRKIKKMMKDGVTVSKLPPIVMPKSPLPKIGAPIVPRSMPKIVSIPKEPVPKVVPVKPVSKELLTEFKEAKTLEEAQEEWKKYGHGNPMTSNFIKDWGEEKKLQTMNRINAQMNSMEKWTRGRKLGALELFDGDQKSGGFSENMATMLDNRIQINYRFEFYGHKLSEKAVASLKGNRFSMTGSDSSLILRHEMGHVLWFDDQLATGTKLREKFTDRFEGINKEVIARNISKYAATNNREFFAEAFTIYSSPKYKMGALNKVFGSGFEELMEKILVQGAL